MSQERIAELKFTSQQCILKYVNKLNLIVYSIWWRPIPTIATIEEGAKFRGVQFAPEWEALNPSFVLTQLVSETYREGATAESLEECSKHSRALFVIKWKELQDILTLTPRDLPEGQLPVVWMWLQFVELSQVYVDAVAAFHEYIFASMYDDLDKETADNFFTDLIKLNSWFGYFKRVWQQHTAVVDKPLEEVVAVMRPDVQALLPRQYRSNVAKSSEQ